MKTTSNKDMLNAIRNQASAEYQEKIPAVTNDMEARAVYTDLQNYPSVANEFINTLMNKVVKTDFFSRVYENPLKQLKKGMLAYGNSIEQLFVKAADAKGFYQEHTTKNDDPKLLIGTKEAKIARLYITKNFAYVFDVSISDVQLKAAFMSANGLSELVNQLVSSLVNGAEQREYEDMKKILTAALAGKQITMKAAIGTDGGLIEDQSNIGAPSAKSGVEQYIHRESLGGYTGSETDARKLAKKIRTMAGKMKFVSDTYNMAKVKTFCNPSDLVLLTTPEIAADLDVEVLAQAFNVSNAEVGVRTILVDSLPAQMVTGTNSNGNPSPNGGQVLAVLMDKDFIQVYDTVNESRTFENGRSLTQNVFLHKQGILATCYFANCVAITAS